MHQRIDFGHLARFLLSERGFTTASLAARVGLTQPSVSRIARKKTVSISADVGIELIRLAGGEVTLPDLPATEGL